MVIITFEDAYLLTRDLVRLGIFSKQCIGCDDMNANINFQAVGSSVCFYLNTLLTDGVYCLTEVANIKVPMAKSELLNYVNQFDKLMLITEVYKRSCIKSSMPIPSEIKRQTLDSPAFRSYINSKSSRGASTQLLF